MKLNQNLALLFAWLVGVSLIAGCCCCGGGGPPADGVRVIIVNFGDLSEEDGEALKEKIGGLAGADSNYSLEIGGVATWDYSPVEDPQALADSIDFADVTLDGNILTLILHDESEEDDHSHEGDEAHSHDTEGDSTETGEGDADAGEGEPAEATE